MIKETQFYNYESLQMTHIKNKSMTNLQPKNKTKQDGEKSNNSPIDKNSNMIEKNINKTKSSDPIVLLPIECQTGDERKKK